MIKFVPDPERRGLRGELFYRPDEYAFDFAATQAAAERPAGAGVTSLLIQSLSLEVDVETGALLYVWGYHPYQRWQRKRLAAPNAAAGALRAETTVQLVAGVAEEVAGTGGWTTFFDPQSHWVCIGAPDLEPTGQAVEFATGCVAVLEQHTLRALWLRPTFERPI